MKESRLNIFIETEHNRKTYWKELVNISVMEIVFGNSPKYFSFLLFFYFAHSFSSAIELLIINGRLQIVTQMYNAPTVSYALFDALFQF